VISTIDCRPPASLHKAAAERCDATARTPPAQHAARRRPFHVSGAPGDDIDIVVQTLPEAKLDTALDLVPRQPAQTGVCAPEHCMVLRRKSEEQIVGRLVHAGIPALGYDSYDP
jgi:hypothetical protein